MPFSLRSTLALLALLPTLGLAAAGCGGGEDQSSGEVPADAIAVIQDNEIERSAYDRLLGQAEATFKARKQDFPKTGTPEYEELKQAIVRNLVEQEQFEIGAEELGIEASDDEVDKRLDELKQQFFKGKDEEETEKKYQAELKKQGLTDEQVRNDIRTRLLSEKIFKEVTKDVTVTDQAVQAFYDESKSQFETPASREVRHILVKQKARAQSLYRQLRGGANFGALAKKFSQDPASKDQGGKFTAQKGATVAPFDKAVFALDTGELSRPVKTQFGWHVIEAVSDVKPKSTKPLTEVEGQIRQQLLQQEQNDAMNKWVARLKERLDDETVYAVGFKPAEQTTTGAETTTGQTQTGQ
jgi:parvulin-like peptidyl-prolyl isomerase